MAGIDIALYVISILLFGAAGFNAPTKVRCEWLAFAVLTLSLVI